MNGDHDSTVTVTVELTGRRATIEDIQQALDTLRAEGIPDTFEVGVDQREDREYLEGVPVADRPITHQLCVTASRAAKQPQETP